MDMCPLMQYKLDLSGSPWERPEALAKFRKARALGAVVTPAILASAAVSTTTGTTTTTTTTTRTTRTTADVDVDVAAIAAVDVADVAVAAAASGNPTFESSLNGEGQSRDDSLDADSSLGSATIDATLDACKSIDSLNPAAPESENLMISDSCALVNKGDTYQADLVTMNSSHADVLGTVCEDKVKTHLCRVKSTISALSELRSGMILVDEITFNDLLQ
jgi:hypothetical protein